MNKRKIKLKKKPIIILLVLIIGIIFLVKSCTSSKEIDSYTPKQTTFLKEFKNISGLSVNDEIKNKIVSYFDLYFLTMKELNEYNFTYLFSPSAQNEANLTQMAMNYFVRYRLLQRNDLKLKDGNYTLTIKEIKNNDNLTTITILEDSKVTFNFMNGIESITQGVKNIFTFNANNELVKVEKSADFYNIITDYYKITKNENETKKDLIELVNNALEKVEKSVENEKLYYESYLENKGITTKKCDHSYDRNSAYIYLEKYALTRNSDYFNFDVYGGNCQNYASQTIHAGGIPMDETGSYKWKYYGSLVDETAAEKGRTPSWTGVGYFYNYAKNNTGAGLCSVTDVNYFYAEKGDIMQVGANNSYVHTIVVSGLVEKDGKIVDVLTTSNSTDRQNYPLSAYNYADKKLIKILGWNE